VTVLYPGSGGVGVPRDAVIYIRVRPGLRPRLKLHERGGREVWLQIKKQPGYWRLSPSRLLGANASYELRLLGVRRGQAVVLTAFQTGAKIHRGGRPAFRGASVTFGAAGKMSMIRRAGREAQVALAADPPPRVVEVRVRFKAGRRWSAAWSAAYAFEPTIRFAGTGACDTLRRAAPARGRYRLELIPWAPNGDKGQPLKLSGVIR
jgi:hypothetical protein